MQRDSEAVKGNQSGDAYPVRYLMKHPLHTFTDIPAGEADLIGIEGLGGMSGPVQVCRTWGVVLISRSPSSPAVTPFSYSACMFSHQATAGPGHPLGEPANS